MRITKKNIRGVLSKNILWYAIIVFFMAIPHRTGTDAFTFFINGLALAVLKLAFEGVYILVSMLWSEIYDNLEEE